MEFEEPDASTTVGLEVGGYVRYGLTAVIEIERCLVMIVRSNLVGTFPPFTALAIDEHWRIGNRE